MHLDSVWFVSDNGMFLAYSILSSTSTHAHKHKINVIDRAGWQNLQGCKGLKSRSLKLGNNSNMLRNAKPVSFENCSKVPEAVIGLGYP